MKRLLFIVVLLLSCPGAAQAGNIFYADEVDEFFNGKLFYDTQEISFATFPCDTDPFPPPGYVRKSFLRAGSGKYYVASSVGNITFYLLKTGDYAYTIAKLERCEPSLCSQYQDLFDPPAPDCNFSLAHNYTCYDGEGNVGYDSYTIISSDGRTATWTEGDPEVVCARLKVHCSIGVGGESSESAEDCTVPYTPPDTPGSGTDNPFDDIPGLISGGGSGGDGGGSGGNNGGGDDGGGDDGGGSDGGDGDGGNNGGGSSGGNNNGGGGTGGNNGGGGGGGGGGGTGGTGNDYTSALNDIISTLNEIKDKLNNIDANTSGNDGGGNTGGNNGGGNIGGGNDGGNNGGGNGGNTGGGSGSGDGGDDDSGSGSWTGDGGFGSLDDVEGMDKGEDDLKGVLDGLMESINKNETIQIIKGHRYITTSSPVCTFTFSLWGETHEISFCEYEDVLRKLGHVLFGLITLAGFMHVVRSI